MLVARTHDKCCGFDVRVDAGRYITLRYSGIVAVFESLEYWTWHRAGPSPASLAEPLVLAGSIMVPALPFRRHCHSLLGFLLG